MLPVHAGTAITPYPDYLREHWFSKRNTGLLREHLSAKLMQLIYEQNKDNPEAAQDTLQQLQQEVEQHNSRSNQ